MDARRYQLDMQGIYAEFRRVRTELRHYAGGMTWKRAKGRDYLFRLHGRKGYGKSLGPRSRETEKVYADFHRRKHELVERSRSLRRAMAEKRPFVRAAGLGRVPRDAANVIRVLDAQGLMDDGMMVLGTHALYAYESLAGIRWDAGLLATGDIDLPFDARRRLRLGGLAEDGLMGLLRQADKTFEIMGRGHFRATNARGFMVELIKPMPHGPHKVERTALSERADDLVAAEVAHLDYLADSKSVSVTAIAEDCWPLQLRVPDPLSFALAKLWTSRRNDREPVKARSDYEQARAVAKVCVSALGPSFDPPAGRNFPAHVVREMRELLAPLGGPSDDIGDIPGLD